jgi:hypothetical protein
MATGPRPPSVLETYVAEVLLVTWDTCGASPRAEPVPA